MNVVAWLVLGLIAGIIANIIDPNPSSGGMWGAVILGILGAVLGGMLSSLIFGYAVTGFNFTSLAISILGSLLLLFVQRAFVSKTD